MSKCDFCSDPHPIWIYPAKNFDVPRHAWGSDGAWAACDECSQLLEDGKYETVVKERMMATVLLGGTAGLWASLSKEERMMVEKETRRLFRRFREARTGGRRRLVTLRAEAD